jgi:glycosyltransferase involved in cell wall biosynthesis
MGIDPDFFKSNENVELNLLNRKPNDFIIAYAGTLGKANALDIIFEAAKVLQTSHPHIRFVFIGNGPLKSSYQEKYKNLERVDFINAVSKENLQNYLKQADVLVNTWLDKPIYKFGISPNKWIDYMYASKPMLIAFSGYRCIIEEAGCGIFIPAENKEAILKAIIKLSETDPEELKKMGINGKNYLLKNLSYKYLVDDFNKKLLGLIKYR